MEVKCKFNFLPPVPFKLTLLKVPIRYFYSKFLPFLSVSHGHLTSMYLPLQTAGNLVYPHNTRAECRF